MQVNVSMETENKFSAGSWWAKSPEAVISSLRGQLEAAQSIWPELKLYTLVKKRDHSKKLIKNV